MITMNILHTLTFRYAFMQCLDTIVLMICYNVYHKWSNLVPPIFGGIGDDVAVFDNLTTHGACFCAVTSVMHISVVKLAFTENNCYNTTV